MAEASGENETGFATQLAEDDRASLRELGRSRRYPSASTLFHEGERSEHVLLIDSGRVKVSSYTEDGKEIVLAIRGPGDLLSDMSVIDGEPRSASATALEDVEALSVSAEDFRSFLASHARASLLLLEIMIRRLRDADRKRIEFGAFDSVGRVARRLLEMADRYGEPDGSGVRIALPLSQEELAGWTGSSREAVSKALKILRDRGLIDTGRKEITVLDVEALRDRAT